MSVECNCKCCQIWRQREVKLQAELAEAKAEIEVGDKIIKERNRILDEFPCPVHGPCVPYVIEKIYKLQELLQKEREKNADYERALEFYAEPSNNSTAVYIYDHGDKARDVLAKHKDGK